MLRSNNTSFGHHRGIPANKSIFVLKPESYQFLMNPANLHEDQLALLLIVA